MRLFDRRNNNRRRVGLLLTHQAAVVLIVHEMRRKPCNVFLTFLAIAITAGPWGLLQSIAWTSMLANDLRTQSMLQSIVHTFDGKHPCPMCKAIAADRKSNKNSDSMVRPW